MMTSLSLLFPLRHQLVWAMIFFCLGSVLSFVNLLEKYQQSSNPAGLSGITEYWEELKGGKTFRLAEATDVVYKGTTHDRIRYIEFRENWVQWLVGSLYAPLRRTQDTNLLIRGGVAECSERSQILKTIAEDRGYRCRFVGLGGHVLLEVFIDNQWHVADPEFGLIFLRNASDLAEKKHEEEIRNALQARNIHHDQIEHYLAIVQSKEDNLRMSIGQSISPRLKVLEEICKWLSWFIPVACLVASFSYFLVMRPSRYQELGALDT